MRSRPRYATVALVATAAMTLAACSGTDAEAPEGTPTAAETTDAEGTDGATPAPRGGTLTLGILNDIPIWDPAQAHVGHRLQPFQPAYDTLILREPDGAYSPMLATEWGFTDDTQTVFSLDLRTDVTFSDDTPFDAEAVKANIEHFQADNGPQAGMAALIESVTAVDADTVEITLSQPDPAIEYYLSQALGLMGSPAALDTEGIDRVPVGTGPYTMSVDESVVGTQYVFQAREGYWNPDLQRFDTIVMKYLPEITSRVNAIVSGEVDAVILDASVEAQAAASGLELLAYPTDWSGLLLMDRDGAMVPELTDVRVRQAINYALDREGMLAQVQSGKGTVTSQVFGPASSAYSADLDGFYTYDPEKARELMADAGYADGFTVTLPLLGGMETLHTFVQQQLGEIGITVVLESVPFADYQGNLGSGKYAAAWFQLFQGPTWVAAKQLLTTDTLYNPFDTTTAELEEMIDAVRADPENAATAQALNAYITEQAWFAPFYRPDQLYFFDATAITAVPQTQMAVPSIYNFAPAS